MILSVYNNEKTKKIDFRKPIYQKYLSGFYAQGARDVSEAKDMHGGAVRIPLAQPSGAAKKKR